MSTQVAASLISFLGIAAIVAVFGFVLARSRGETAYSEVQPGAYRIRKWFFIALAVGFIVVPALTLRSLPYSADAAGATVVDVTAHQWYWTLSQKEVPASQPIVFRVASEDVNHGFAIYTESNQLVAQVQAMPGYVNELAVEFDVPGTYKIMCLEYCGLVHHSMVDTLQVVAATGEGSP